MKVVEIRLTFPESLGAFIQSQVAAGRYGSVDEYVRDLVRADQQQQNLLADLGDYPPLVAQLERGLASGHGRRWSGEVMNEIKHKLIEGGPGKRADG